MVAFVVRFVVRSGVNPCGICGRGANTARAELLVETMRGVVVPPRNEKVLRSIPQRLGAGGGDSLSLTRLACDETSIGEQTHRTVRGAGGDLVARRQVLLWTVTWHLG